jgi:hypothetical protein
MISQSSEILSTRAASTPDFATGLDARREIGSTPAGSDAGTTPTLCEHPQRSWLASKMKTSGQAGSLIQRL